MKIKEKIKGNSLLMFVFVGLLSFVLSGCGSSESVNDLNKIKERGTLIVGTNVGYPPYEFSMQQDGKEKLVGVDIELAKLISKEIGVEVKFKNMPFDGLIAALQAGKVDIVLAGITETSERKKSVDFSDTYYLAGNSIVALEGSKYSNIESLKGKKIAAQIGSVQAKVAKEIEGAKVKELTQLPDIVEQVKLRKVDAAIVGEIVAKGYESTNKGIIKSFAIKKGAVDSDANSIAIRKSQPELLKLINEIIDKNKSNGQIDKLFDEAIELNAKSISL